MKISKKIIMIAGIVAMLSCNHLFGKIVKDGTCFYVTGFAEPRSQSESSKEIALSKAELNALGEFANYVFKEKLIIPRSIRTYDSQIRDCIVQKNYSGIIKGSRTIKRLILKDGRACCVVCIPSDNITNFPAIDYRKNHDALLSDISRNLPLKYEVAVILGAKNAELFSKEFQSLFCNKTSINRIPSGWLLSISDIENIKIESLADNELIDLFEALFGIKNIEIKIAEELKKRGFKNCAKRILEVKLPYDSSKKEIVDISPNYAKDLPVLISVLNDYNSSILFENSKSVNQDFNLALAEFSKRPTDFVKVREYATKSLCYSVSDSAFNLIGRTFEEQKDLKLAILFYKQAVVMNSNTPYAKANLAKCFYALGELSNASFWANETLRTPNVPEWSKNRANEILTSIKSKNENN